MRHQSKWDQALGHIIPSSVGWVRMFFRQPLWALKLLKTRAGYFSNRAVNGPIPTPDQFVIESPHELVSYWSLFVERECWAPEWITRLLHDPKPLVLDVGANAGLFTHHLWTLRPDSEFIAFEPLPRMAAKIRNWKTRTGANLTLHENAVSDHCGTAVFHASEDNDPTASLKPEGAKGLQLKIPIVTLDSVVPKRPVLLMKVDVEGCECEVLAGANETLERTRFLILEANTPEALDKIKKQLGPAWHSKRVGANDFLFER